MLLLTGLSLVVAGLTTTVLVTRQVNLEPGQALVKGRVETGYEYVGFIISDKQKVCAATLLDETTLITAAHCLAPSAGEKFSFGIGDFTVDTDKLTAISVINYAPGFQISSNLGPDLALAKLSAPIPLQKYAVLGKASESCNASIVAYGAGIDSGVAGAELFKKKSGEGCARAITSNFLVIFNREVGMCFGDSGGPIFEAPGSNVIIGILSGGLIDNRLEKLVCDPGNTGYVVNVDSYAGFLNDRQFASSPRTGLRIVEAAEPGDLSVDLSRLEPAGAMANNADNGGVNSVVNSDNIWLVIASLGIITIATIFLINRVLRR